MDNETIIIAIIIVVIMLYVWGSAIIGVGVLTDNLPDPEYKRGWLKVIFTYIGIIIGFNLVIVLFGFIVGAAGGGEGAIKTLEAISRLGGLIILLWLAYMGNRKEVRESITQAGYFSYHLLCFSLSGAFFMICFVPAVIAIEIFG